MKSSLLTRLRNNGTAYIVSGLLLLLAIPLYQILVLGPLGFDSAFSITNTAHFVALLHWIHEHLFQFILYRALLILAFVLILTLPFSLFRIIVAQEIMAQQEREAEEKAQPTDSEESENDVEGVEDETQKKATKEGVEEIEETEDGMPAYAWRGKGFVVVAAWSGMIGLVVYILSSLGSVLYYTFMGSNEPAATPPGYIMGALPALLAISSNTVGIGFLALSTLFFGAMIARSGLRLWPSIWVAFSYVGIAVAGLFSGSAVAVASDPTSQAALSTPSILLFALWVLWLGIMLVRLKPEA